MRKVVKWVVLSSLPALVLGCFSSSSGDDTTADAASTDDGGGSDATNPPGSDGSSPETSTTPHDAATEAGAADSAVDSSATDGAADTGTPTEAGASDTGSAGPPVVTVVVTSAIGPEQDVPAVFEDGFGQVLTTVSTDDLGRASAAVSAGTQVTVIMGTVTAPQLVTIQAIAPGDVLSFYDTSYDVVDPQISLQLADAGGPPPGTASVRAEIGSCSGDVPGTTYLNSPDCMYRGTFPVLAIAQGGQDAGYADLGYAYQKNNVVSTDGGPSVVTLAGPWYTNIGSQSLAMSDTGSGYPELGFSHLAGNVAATQSEGFGYNAQASDQFQTFPAYADALQSELSLSTNNEYTESVTGIAIRGAGDGGPTTFDVTQILPTIDSANIDSSMPAQPILTWSAAGSLASVDGTVAVMTWFQSSDNGQINGSWTFVAPPTVTSITAPAVSSLYGMWVPSDQSSFGTPVVVAFEADFITSYTQLRAMASALPLTQGILSGYTNNNMAEAPPLPVDGTLRFSASTINGD